MRRRIPWTAPLLATAILAASPLVRAGEANNVAAAQTLFDEGKQLAASGNYTAACAKFMQSQQLEPAGGTLMHLAACHESEGKTATAWSEFNEALSWARRDGRADREAYAKARLAEIQPTLVRLTVTVASASRARGLVVSRDGRPVREVEWGAAIPVDPGEHLIEAEAPGYARWVSRTRVDRQTGNVTVAIPALAADVGRLAGAPATSSAPNPTNAASATTIAAALPLGPQTPAAPLSPPSDTPSDSRSARRNLGIAVGAGGLAGLAVALVVDLRAHAKASDRDAAARAGDAEATAALHKEARSAQTIALIVGGAALATLGTGVALYMSGRTSHGDVHVVPQVAANQVGVLLEVVR